MRLQNTIFHELEESEIKNGYFYIAKRNRKFFRLTKLTQIQFIVDGIPYTGTFKKYKRNIAKITGLDDLISTYNLKANDQILLGVSSIDEGIYFLKVIQKVKTETEIRNPLIEVITKSDLKSGTLTLKDLKLARGTEWELIAELISKTNRLTKIEILDIEKLVRARTQMACHKYYRIGGDRFARWMKAEEVSEDDIALVQLSEDRKHIAIKIVEGWK